MNNYDTKQRTNSEIKIAFMKCFNTREGEIVLSFLRRLTIERYLGPEATNEELRHLEGQRHLVGYIHSLMSEQ